MAAAPEYSMNMDIRFQPLECIDIPAVVRACNERWYNQTLCAVNDCVVRLGIIDGDFHWHKQDNEDEFFYVIAGRLLIDTENETTELFPQQGFLVPRGVMHRTRAPERTTVLMVEGRTVTPTGD